MEKEEELRYEEREMEIMDDDGNPLHPEEQEDEQEV